MATVRDRSRSDSFFSKRLQAAAELLHRLGVLGGARRLSLGGQVGKFALTHLGQALAAGQKVHGQLLEVGEVQLVELVERGRVLHELHLMTLEGLGDLVDIGLGGVVAGLERRDFVRRLLEQAEEALVVVIHVEVLELGHYSGDKIARLAQILGAHLRERRLRERRHLLLGARRRR